MKQVLARDIKRGDVIKIGGKISTVKTQKMKNYGGYDLSIFTFTDAGPYTIEANRKVWLFESLLEPGVRKNPISPEKFVKIRFTKGNEATAGLVMDWDKYKSASVATISRLFPVSEAGKMSRLEVSPKFGTFDEAFAFQFESLPEPGVKKNPVKIVKSGKIVSDSKNLAGITSYLRKPGVFVTNVNVWEHDNGAGTLEIDFSDGANVITDFNSYRAMMDRFVMPKTKGRNAKFGVEQVHSKTGTRKKNPVDPKIYARPQKARSRSKMVSIQCSADGVHFMNCGIERTVEAAKKRAHELDAESGHNLYFKLKL